MTHDKKLYSIDECCKLLGIGRTKLYNEIKQKKINAKKCGNRTLVSSKSLDKWWNELPDFE